MTGIKKIFLTILALLTLSSCAQGDLAAGGGDVTTPPVADSAETEDVQPDGPSETEPDASSPVETEPEEDVTQPPEEEFVLKKRRFFTVSAEEVEAEPMKYTSYDENADNKRMYIVSLDDIVATVEKYQSVWVMM